MIFNLVRDFREKKFEFLGKNRDTLRRSRRKRSAPDVHNARFPLRRKEGTHIHTRAEKTSERMPRATRSGKLTGGGGLEKEEEEDEEKRRKETKKKNVGNGGDDFGDESDSDDAPPEEVARADAEKETREEQMMKKRAIEMQQISKEREKEKRLEKEKERQEAAAKRKREKEERAMEKRKEEEHEDEDDEAEEVEDPDAFTLDEDIVDAVAANENELKEKYLRDFYDTKSQRKKRKKQLKRERMREEAMGRQSAKFTTRDGFDVVIRSKVDELAEMKTNPKALDFARQRLDAKHRRDERMLCDTRTGKIKNQFAVR